MSIHRNTSGGFSSSTTNINLLLNVIRREKKVEDNFPKLSTEDCFNLGGK